MRHLRFLPILALLATFAATTGVSADKNDSVKAASKKRIVVIAHRGPHEVEPENTLAAFRKGIEIGCDYVELDVRRTKDGALVLMHDSTVNSKTDGKGAVADMTLDEIRALDAGIKKGAQFKGEKVPLFEEALALCKKGKMKIYVDNKSGPPDEVIAAIEKHDMLKDVIIYDGPAKLRTFKKLRPAVWILPPHPGGAERITAMARDLKPEALDGNMRSWTQEQIDAAHTAGVQVWVDVLGVWDNEKGIRKAAEMGVDGMQTDHPAMVIRVLKEMGLR